MITKSDKCVNIVKLNIFPKISKCTFSLGLTCDHALYYVVEPDTILIPVAFHPHSSFTTEEVGQLSRDFLDQ